MRLGDQNDASFKRMKITTESDIVLNKFEEILIDEEVKD